MTVRFMVPSDAAVLTAMQGQFPYVTFDAPTLETVLVVADEEDRPLCAMAAERIIQLFFWCGDLGPLEKKMALRLLHEEGANVLKQKGYKEVNAFLSPQIALKFSKRLERSFQWRPNWPSWFRRL